MCEFSSDGSVVRSALFGCEDRPLPSLSAVWPYSLEQRVQGAYIDRTDHVTNASGSALVRHLLQRVEHGTLRYED